jgi:type IX secretion system PorP/SprF family membrane protein
MRKVVSLLLLSLYLLSSYAQDIHFSQYYASPLTLNPALTGKFDGLWRVNAIYRGQWFAPKDLQPYSTVAGSVDFSLLKDKMKGNALGVGLLVINDQQNFRAIADPSNPFNGQKNTINQTKIALGLAYTLAFGKTKNTQLSVGFQPQLEFRNMNFNYTFNDGFNPDLTYDPTRAGENLTAGALPMAFNFSAGAFFNTKPLDWLTFYAGYSMFNIARPKDNVLTAGTTAPRDFRHAANVGFEFEIKKRFLIIPGGYFQYMAKSTEIAVGTTAGYKILNTDDKTAIIFLGCWGRVGRDVIPKVGFEYNRFRFGAAFDVRLSQLQKDSKAAIASSSQPLAFEFSLTYIGGMKKLSENNFLFNPRY